MCTLGGGGSGVMRYAVCSMLCLLDQSCEWLQTRLVTCGMAAALVTQEGKTAAQLAHSNGHEHVKEVLWQAGADMRRLEDATYVPPLQVRWGDGGPQLKPAACGADAGAAASRRARSRTAPECSRCNEGAHRLGGRTPQHARMMQTPCSM